MGGRSILFVSHNLEAVRTLTHSGIVLEKGEVIYRGAAVQAITAYWQMLRITDERKVISVEEYRRPRSGEGSVTIEKIFINGKEGQATVEMLNDCEIVVWIRSKRIMECAVLDAVLRNEQNERVVHLFSNDFGRRLLLKQGLNCVKCWIPQSPWSPGRYTLDLGVAQDTTCTAWDVIQGYPGLKVVLGSKAEGLGWPDRPWGTVHHTGVQWDWSVVLDERSIATRCRIEVEGNGLEGAARRIDEIPHIPER